MKYSILVFFMALFVSANAEAALNCPAGQVSGYSFTRTGGEVVNCASPAACAQAHFVPSTTNSVAGGGTISVTVTHAFGSFTQQSGVYAFYTWTKTTSTVSDSGGASGSSTTNHQAAVRIKEVCIDDTPDPLVEECNAKQGEETSFTTSESNSSGGCVNGCQVSTGSGGRVQVQLGNDPEIYTSGAFSGSVCGGSDSELSVLASSDPIRMEYVDGVPTFTNNGSSIKLPTSTSGNIESQVQALNPQTPVDVTASDVTTSELDNNTKDPPLTDTQPVMNVTNITNNVTGQTGGYSLTSGTNTDGVTDETGGGSGSGGGSENGNTDNSGIETKLDEIKDEIDEIGDGVSFSGDDSKTFSGVTSNFMTEISNSPLLSMGQGISFGTGSGTCPTIAASTYVGVLETDLHCTIFDNVKSLLSIVMLFIWGFFGIRIILSA